MIGPILRRAEAGRQPSFREVALLLQAKGPEGKALLQTAGRLSRHCKGEGIGFWGLIQLRPADSPSGLVRIADKAWRMGCHTIYLQASEPVDSEAVATAIARMKRTLPVQVALELGEHSYDEYAVWRQAGAERYILPHETSNSVHYAQLHPGRTPSDRFTRYLWLRGMGYQVGGGFITPSADQRMPSLVDEIEVLMNVGMEAVVLQPTACPTDLYKLLAVVRLCLPRADIYVTPHHPELQSQSLMCGANIVLTAVPTGVRPSVNEPLIPAGGPLESMI